MVANSEKKNKHFENVICTTHYYRMEIVDYARYVEKTKGDKVFSDKSPLVVGEISFGPRFAHINKRW